MSCILAEPNSIGFGLTGVPSSVLWTLLTGQHTSMPTGNRKTRIVWQIPESVNCVFRDKIDSGWPTFAWLDYLLLPATEAEIAVAFDWSDPADERWNEAIQAGVADFVAYRQKVGRPVGFSRVVLKRVISHDIVTDDYTVTTNMKLALQNAFETYERLVSDELWKQ